MSPPRSGVDPYEAPLAWTVEFLLDRTRRVQGLIGVAYLTAIAGLGVTFAQGTFDPVSPGGTLGVVLLSISFVAFFAACVTILGAGGSWE